MQALPLKLVGGAVILVPPSIKLLTTYVLLEQEDWFEKEIAFVRRVLSAGMRAVDIGANYGVYSLALAGAVGPDGRVWAFEPASATLRHLRGTMVRNSLTHVDIQGVALSDHAGVGRLSTGVNSELNSLTAAGDSDHEEVALATLDAEADRLGIQGIDFLKLDAEGEEVRILAGAGRFFAREDPLVMFEVKHGEGFNRALPDAFRALGFDLYRLIGPSSYLVPLGQGEVLDEYELNLFACKPRRALQLEQRGLLIREIPSRAGAKTGSGATSWRRASFSPSCARSAREMSAGNAHAFDCLALWMATAETPANRYAGLLAAVAALEQQALSKPTFAGLSTLARAAAEAGRRELAVRTLGRMLDLVKNGRALVTEPCWPAIARYDDVPVVGDIGIWLTAAAVEAFAKWSAYSAYFAGPGMLPMLDWIQATPYASASMERRRQLQSLQAARATCIAASPQLAIASPDHLNVDFWARAARSSTVIPLESLTDLVAPL